MCESRTTRACISFGQYSEKMVFERAIPSSTQNVLAQYLRRILTELLRQEENGFESDHDSFRLEQLIDVLLRAESICPQSTQLVSILHLCYGFSRYAYLRYAFLRYAFSRYAFLRYPFSRYAFSRYAFYHSVCLSAFWLAAWHLKRVFAFQLRFDAFPIWNIESACCYSALDWCMSNLDNLILIPGYWILS